MAQVDPNPQTNPALLLECANCKAQGLPTPPWIWHTPPGAGPAQFGTEVGGYDDIDSSQPLEINVKHPHCPVCGSHAVNILDVIQPS